MFSSLYTNIVVLVLKEILTFQNKKMVPLRALSLLLAICTIHGFKKEKVDMLMPQVAPQSVSIFVETNSNVMQYNYNIQIH